LDATQAPDLKQQKEKNQMARSKPDDPFDDDWGTGEPAAAQSDEMPEPPEETRINFIRPKDVGKDLRGKFELVRVTNKTTDYSDVVFLIKYKGSMYELGLKYFSKDYKRLQKRFGTKKEDWHGDIEYRVVPHRGNPLGFFEVR
jgi:hypothetical protein